MNLRYRVESQGRTTSGTMRLVLVLLCMSGCTLSPGPGSKRGETVANNQSASQEFQTLVYKMRATTLGDDNNQQDNLHKEGNKTQQLLNDTKSQPITEQERKALANLSGTMELKTDMYVNFQPLDWPWLIDKITPPSPNSTNPPQKCIDLNEKNPNPESMEQEAKISLINEVFKPVNEATSQNKKMYEYLAAKTIPLYFKIDFKIDPSTGKIEGTITDNQEAAEATGTEVPIDSENSFMRINGAKKIVSISYKLENTSYENYPAFLQSIEHTQETTDGEQHLIHRSRTYAKSVTITGTIDENNQFTGENDSFNMILMTKDDTKDPINCFFVCKGRLSGKTTGTATFTGGATTGIYSPTMRQAPMAARPSPEKLGDDKKKI